MAIFQFDPETRSLDCRAFARDGHVIELSMVLDTGSTRTTVPLWVAERLELPPAVKQSTAATPTGVLSTELRVVPRFGALGYSLSNLEVSVVDLPAVAGVDGLLGLDFLRNYSLFIDFPRGKMTLLPGEPSFWERLRGFIELIRIYW